MSLRPEMVFLDTAYVVSRVNTRDQWHTAAAQWEQRLAVERRPLLTTEFILIEIADTLAAVKFRQQAIQIIEALQQSPLVTIVPASSWLLAEGLARYRQRSDKDWGLTDCLSFVVMEEYSLTEALTLDHHFQQAGFRALLLENPRQ